MPVILPAKDVFIWDKKRIAIWDKQAMAKPQTNQKNKGEMCFFKEEKGKLGGLVES